MNKKFFAVAVLALIGLPLHARSDFSFSAEILSVGESTESLFGGLELSWEDFREQLVKSMTEVERKYYDPEHAEMKFTVKRRVGFGNYHLKGDYEGDLADVVKKGYAATTVTDPGFGKLPGHETVHYWIEGEAAVPENTNLTWTVHGHVVARNRYSISIGMSDYSRQTWGEDRACQMEHVHDGQEALLFHELTGGWGPGLYYTVAQVGESGIVGGLTDVGLTNIFGQASRVVKPGDIVYFYLATHGNQNDFALYDKPCPSSKLAECVSMFKDKGVRLFGVLNMCHAGAHIKQFESSEYSFSAWVAAASGISKTQEAARCFDIVSGFGRTFLEWGWRDGYGKLSHVHAANGDWVATEADQSSGYLTAYEAAHYAELMFPGTSSSHEQHVKYVRPKLLKKIPLRKITDVPTSRSKWDQPDGPAIAMHRNDTLGFVSLYLDEGFKDSIFLMQLSGAGKSFWCTGYSDEDGSQGVPIYTRLQYIVFHNSAKRVADVEDASVPFVTGGNEYSFHANIMFPTGWSLPSGTGSFYADDDSIYMRYLGRSGKLRSAPMITLANGLSVQVAIDTIDALQDGRAGVDVRLVLNDGEDETYGLDLYGRVSDSGDSFHFDASEKMSSNLKHIYPWLDTGDDKFYFTITPARVAGHIGGKDFKAPLCLKEEFQYTEKLKPVAWEGVVPTLGTHMKDFDGTEVTPWDEDEKWKPDSTYRTTVTVLFDPNGGTCSERRRTVRMASIASNFPTPTRVGYVFEGWYTSPIGGNKIESTNYLLDDIVLYAHWIRKEGAGEGDDGCHVGARIVEGCEDWGTIEGGNSYYATGETIAMTAKAKDGFVFAGWYDTPSADNAIDAPVHFQQPKLEYEVNGVNTNFYANFIAITSDWATVNCEVDDSYTLGELIRDVVIDARGGSLPTVKVTGLPAGLQFTPKKISVKAGEANVEIAANSIYGTPKKNGSYLVTVVVSTVDGANASTNIAINVRAAGEYLISAVCDAHMGRVTGAGSYQQNKKVTLKATANKGYVLSGWYDAVGDLVAQTPSLSYVMPPHDVTLQARFIPASNDWATVDCVTEAGSVWVVSNETKVAIAPISVAVAGGSLPTVKVTGLPTGLKFTAKDIMKKGSKMEVDIPANTIYGTPTKGGVYNATVTVTTAGKASVVRAIKFIIRTASDYVVDADWNPVQGKVTGAGVYQAGKKVTLRATANKGYVFAGWYEGGVDGGHAGRVTLPAGEPVSRLASYVLTMPTNDVAYVAKFVTTDEDEASISADVNGFSFGAGSGGEGAAVTKLATNVMTGVYLAWPVAANALSETTVKVAGLPSGLKFTAKPITSKVTSGTGSSKVTTVVTNVAANTIYGAPTAVSKTAKDKTTGLMTVTPSKVKVTVTTAGKSKAEYVIDLTVDPLPAWAQGEFSGLASTPEGRRGSVSMSVTAAGKVSGKVIVNGTNCTFSAASYDITSQTVGETNLVAVVTGKLGKDVVSGGITVVASGATGTFAGAEMSLCRNVWKDKGAEPVPEDAQGLYTVKLGVDERGTGYLSLTVDKKGAVKVAGKAPDGTALSGSATLMPNGDGAYFTEFFAAPSAYKGGYVAGRLGWDADGKVSSDGLDWTSFNPQSTTNYYDYGFSRGLSVSGARYVKDDAPKSLGVADVRLESPEGAELKTFSFTQSTGIWKGSLIWDFGDPVLDPVKVPFEGVMVQGEDLEGFGTYDVSASYVPVDKNGKSQKAKTYKVKESLPIRFAW